MLLIFESILGSSWHRDIQKYFNFCDLIYGFLALKYTKHIYQIYQTYKIWKFKCFSIIVDNLYLFFNLWIIYLDPLWFFYWVFRILKFILKSYLYISYQLRICHTSCWKYFSSDFCFLLFLHTVSFLVHGAAQIFPVVKIILSGYILFPFFFYLLCSS